MNHSPYTQPTIMGYHRGVEESITRFGLHNDLIFENDVIKENKFILYALVHGFHEQEVS